MNSKPENKSIGTVLLGCETATPRKIEIEDFVRCEFKDHRLVSVVRTEEEGFLFSIENPPSTGRAIEQKMYLTGESAVALFTTYILYLENRGINIQDLFQKYEQGNDVINYEFGQK